MLRIPYYTDFPLHLMAEKLATVPTCIASLERHTTEQQQSGSVIMKSIVELANIDQTLTTGERVLLLDSEQEAELRMGLEECEDDESASLAAQLKDFAEDIDYMARKHHPVLAKIFNNSHSIHDLREACRKYLWNILRRSIAGRNIYCLLILAYLLVRECVRRYLAGMMGDSLADYLICIVEEVGVEFVRNKVYPFIQSHGRALTTWVSSRRRECLIGVGVAVATVGVGWWYLRST